MRPRLPQTSLVTVNFHPNAWLPSHPVYCLLNDTTHVLRPQTAARFHSRPKQGLWVRISANRFADKATVRRWAGRRVRAAVEDALNARGLRFNGTAVEGTGRKNLRGTLELFVNKESVAAKYSDIRAELGKVVDALTAPQSTR
ncbi:MAG: hypothetical protein L6R40_007104 [Gallowayella cf. fulva]|nr:MAG: hypothetical protein L6R40_007104 [Xanthomendoza cf. fulva]